MEKHIICGPSAAGTLRQYLRQHLGQPADGVVTFPDDLSIGPLVPIKNNIDEFIVRRKEFWQSNTSDPDFVTYITSDLEKFIPAILEANKLTLWVAPGAREQFMWAWLIHVFDIYKLDWKNVEVKHLFNEETRKFKYIILGELRVEEFSKCQTFEINSVHVAALKEAYTAISAPSPDKIIEICNREISPLPELQGSIKTYLKEYPDSKTGLTIFDKALLLATTKGRSKSARVIGYSMCSDEFEQRLGIGDGYLFHRLVKLSKLPHPLIELFGTIKEVDRGYESIRSTEVVITELGKQVLAGEINHIDLNGIDEYIGGVHLSSENNTDLWLYKDGSLISA